MRPTRTTAPPATSICRVALMLCAGSLMSLLATTTARASERRFASTYESLVLNPGHVEVEQWNTVRGGREQLYLRFDERVELEIGVLENVQTSWYLNGTAITAADGDALRKDVEFGGVSNEWKWKLLDPVADAAGLALYGEWTAAPSEAELEVKVILDKRFGDMIAALNVTGEAGWELDEVNELDQELVVGLDAGLAYLLTPSFALGLEAHHEDTFTGEGLEHAVLFAGPTLSYATQGWWVAVSAMPQVVDLAAVGSPELQDLEHSERITARVLLGFDI